MRQVNTELNIIYPLLCKSCELPVTSKHIIQYTMAPASVVDSFFLSLFLSSCVLLQFMAEFQKTMQNTKV